MSVSTASPMDDRVPRSFGSGLRSRQLYSYPDTAPRFAYLALVVLITTALYYELYVGGSVAPLQLATLHMSFSFYVLLLAFGNLIGAFGSLFAGLADRVGRCNLVVVGLLITGVMVALVIPNATNRWAFGIEGFAVGLVEGICLVATPALIRDFSPQVGRGAAMGFWTMGPVLGSLVVSVVGSHTINATTKWPHEYYICGIAGLVVFVLAFLFLRELSPGIRDQLMVTTRDRALVEARAKGIDIEASLRSPWKQLLKADIIVSAIGISVFLLIYYTAVAFGTIYFETIFGFSLKDANGLGNWNWGINAISLVVIGIITDRFRVRKPFMVIGGVFAAIMMVVYLEQAGHHPTYYHVALLIALLSLGLGIAYTPWMASFTETVEARNPALTATGLAIWGWIIRVTIFVSFLVLPAVVNTVTPLVNYGGTVQADAAQYKSQLAFAQANPALVSFAQKNASALDFAAANPSLVAQASVPANAAELGTLAKFAPEVRVIAANPSLFARLAAYPNPSAIPPALLAQAVAAAGGGSKGLAVLQTIGANKPAILGALGFAQTHASLVAQATKYSKPLTALGALAKSDPTMLANVQAHSAQLAALGKIPPSVTAYLTAHAAAVTKAAKDSPSQWKNWYWICFGGMIAFLLAIPLLKGRWNPKLAKADEDAHEAMVQEELAKLNA